MNNTTLMPLSGRPVMDIRLAVLKLIAKVWGENSWPEVPQPGPYVELGLELEDVGYVNPFSHFKVKFLSPYAIWDLYGDHQWTKHKYEILEICIPLPPVGKKWIGYEGAEKLMEYYSYFPTFFGPQKKPTPPNKIDCDQPPISPSGNDYHLESSLDPFLSFSSALIKLIAAIWEDPSLKDEILYSTWVYAPPGKEIDPEAEANYYKKIRKIFKRYYHYESPWRFNLRFTTSYDFWDNNGEWNPREDIKNKLYIEIPCKPGASKENVGLALARYNAMGPAYPFTCS